MGIENIDRDSLKLLIKEILKEDISLFKEAIKELLIENQIITSETNENRRKRLEKFIEQDFDKYDDVFKALA